MSTQWLSISAAVTTMIEEDPELEVPYSYDTKIGGDICSILKSCIETCERRLESEQLYGDESDRRRAKHSLEHAEFVLERAQLYLDDLTNELHLVPTGKSSSLDIRDSTNESSGSLQLSRASLVEWAYQVHRVDIGGFHARRRGEGVPIEPRYTDKISTADIDAASRRYLADPKKLWQQYIKGEWRKNLFSSIRCLLSIYLDQAYPRWRNEVKRLGIANAKDLYKKGTVVKKDLASAIAIEGGDSDRTYEKHLDSLLDSLLNANAKKSAFTPRQMRVANQMLYGLAFAFMETAGELTRVTHNAISQDAELFLSRLHPHLPHESGINLDSFQECIHLAWNPENRSPKKSR